MSGFLERKILKSARTVRADIGMNQERSKFELSKSRRTDLETEIIKLIEKRLGKVSIAFRPIDAPPPTITKIR